MVVTVASKGTDYGNVKWSCLLEENLIRAQTFKHVCLSDRTFTSRYPS